MEICTPKFTSEGMKKTMTKTVTKVGAISKVRDKLSDNSVALARPVQSCFGCLQAQELCLENDIVNSAHLVAGVANTDSSGHIRAIATVENTEVHG